MTAESVQATNLVEEATLRDANRLLVLDHGKRAELGTHDELMAKKGIYHTLITTQRRMAGSRAL